MLAGADRSRCTDCPCHINARRDSRRCAQERIDGGACSTGNRHVGCRPVSIGHQIQESIAVDAGGHRRAHCRKCRYAIDCRLHHDGQIARRIAAFDQCHGRADAIQSEIDRRAGSNGGVACGQIDCTFYCSLAGDSRQFDRILARLGCRCRTDIADQAVGGGCKWRKQCRNIVEVIGDGILEFRCIDGQRTILLKCDADIRQVFDIAGQFRDRRIERLAQFGLDRTDRRITDQRTGCLAFSVVGGQLLHDLVDIVECLDKTIDGCGDRCGVACD